MARLPKRSVALRARVVFALLMHRAHMLPQNVRSPERSVALRARVVSALLVHHAHMLPQIADFPGLVVALRARVLLLLLLGHLVRRGGRFCEESESVGQSNRGTIKSRDNQIEDNQIEGLEFPLLSVRDPKAAQFL
jgi:hypothetical protein